MKNYQEIETPFGQTILQYEENGVLYTIPKDPANSDYQAYLAAQSTPIDTEDE